MDNVKEHEDYYGTMECRNLTQLTVGDWMVVPVGCALKGKTGRDIAAHGAVVDERLCPYRSSADVLAKMCCATGGKQVYELVSLVRRVCPHATKPAPYLATFVEVPFHAARRSMAAMRQGLVYRGDATRADALNYVTVQHLYHPNGETVLPDVLKLLPKRLRKTEALAGTTAAEHALNTLVEECKAAPHYLLVLPDRGASDEITPAQWSKVMNPWYLDAGMPTDTVTLKFKGLEWLKRQGVEFVKPTGELRDAVRRQMLVETLLRYADAIDRQLDVATKTLADLQAAAKSMKLKAIRCRAAASSMFETNQKEWSDEQLVRLP